MRKLWKDKLLVLVIFPKNKNKFTTFILVSAFQLQFFLHFLNWKIKNKLKNFIVKKYIINIQYKNNVSITKNHIYLKNNFTIFPISKIRNFTEFKFLSHNFQRITICFGYRNFNFLIQNGWQLWCENFQKSTFSIWMFT